MNRVLVRPTVLVCDDESSIREAFTLILQDDFRVVTVATGEAALKKVTDDKVDLVFLDIRMPGMDGIEALQKIKQIDQNIPIVMVTAVNDVQKASLATKLGAYNYIVKPFNVEEMLRITKNLISKKSLAEDVRPIREQKLEGGTLPKLIGQTRRISEIREMIPELAKSKVPIFLVGESGTEKRTIAELLHLEGSRSAGPFFSFLCTAFSERGARTKLLGQERGTFAVNLAREVGMVEHSHGGTLFLDHVEKLSPSIQKKLAEVVRERRIIREGSEIPIELDVTFVFSGAPGISQELDPAFREICMQTVLEIPPLRERLEDLSFLIQHFLELASLEFGRSLKPFDESVLSILESYEWPGNLEELKRVVERLVFFSEAEQPLWLTHLPLSIFSKLDFSRYPSDSERFSLDGLGNLLERAYLSKVLEKVQGREEEAARLLGVAVNALKLKCELLHLPSSI